MIKGRKYKDPRLLKLSGGFMDPGEVKKNAEEHKKAIKIIKI